VARRLPNSSSARAVTPTQAAQPLLSLASAVITPLPFVDPRCRLAAAEMAIRQCFTVPGPYNTEISGEAPSLAPASSAASHCWAAPFSLPFVAPAAC
jgi:hypothetical protein